MAWAASSTSSLALAAIVLALAYFLLTRHRKPVVSLYHAGEAEPSPGFNPGQLVQRNVPALSTGFTPVWWLPEGNTQTIYTSLADFADVDPVVYERKLVRVADGGIIALDISPPLHSHPIRSGETVLVIAHGLTGGSHEHYVRAAVKTLTAPASFGGLAARAVVINSRGCNDSPVVTPKLYHAGSSDDVRTIVLWAAHTFPQSTLFGLGFSLGANMIAKYAGEEGDNCPLSGAVALANGWDFNKCGKFNEHGTLMNRHVYRYVLGGALQALYHRNQKIFRSAPDSPLTEEDLEDLFSRKKLSLVAFDDLITPKVFGFKDAWDYYDQISSVHFLDRVRIPLLGINALDDPIMGTSALPVDQARRNPWFVLATTKSGGHMGWFEAGKEGRLGRWYVKPTLEYFKALLEAKLPPRPRPVLIKDERGLLQDRDRPEVAFADVDPESYELFKSGAGESKLVSGW